MFFAYILFSKSTGDYYKGSSADPEVRLEKKHNKGKVRSTKYGIPWILIYKESFSSRSEAFKREQFFKSAEGRIWLIENGIIPQGIVSSPKDPVENLTSSAKF